MLFAQPLIGNEHTWALWAIMVAVAAGSIWLEQTYSWANRVTGCILALGGMMVLSNLGIIPYESTVYDQVWGFIVPLAIPMLLFQCNLKKIFRESGRLLSIFLISSVGTVLGTITSYFLLRKFIPHLDKIAAIFTGTYVGGSVNFAALSDSFAVPTELISAAVIADNLLMALYFFVLIALPSIGFFRRHYPHPYTAALPSQETNASSSFWKKKEIGLCDIALIFACALLIVAAATELSALITARAGTGGTLTTLLLQMLGNKYLLITTITIVLSTLFPKKLGQLAGANEIGTFLIYIFFAVIGAPASIGNILTQSPLLLVYAFIAVLINMTVTLVFGKVFHFSIEEIVLASNANIGGPTTAAAMAISKGWGVLVGPIMLIGTLGYILGNYYGLLVGYLLVR